MRHVQSSTCSERAMSSAANGKPNKIDENPYRFVRNFKNKFNCGKKQKPTALGALRVFRLNKPRLPKNHDKGRRSQNSSSKRIKHILTK